MQMEKFQTEIRPKDEFLKETNKTTVVLFLSGIAVISSLYMTIPLLPIIANDYGISLQQAAWAGSIFSIFFALGCLFFGAIAERVGLKNVLVGGMIGLSIITFFIGWAASFTQLLVLRALQGAIAATFSPPSITYIGVMFPEKKRLATSGLVTSGFLMSGVIGQFISSFMAVYTHWQAVFYLFSLIYLLVAYVLFYTLTADTSTEEGTTFPTVIQHFGLPFKKRSLRLSFGVAITLLLGFIGMCSAPENSLTTHFHFRGEAILSVRAGG